MGKRFVVLQQDVVIGLQPLDQVVFQQESFGLGRRFDDFDPVDLGNHPLDAHTRPFGMRVVFQTPAQDFGLADVQDFSGRVQHPVNPRPFRKKPQMRRDIRRPCQLLRGFA